VTLLTSLARAVAAHAGHAQPTKTRRHVHLSSRPLMLIPLQLAGEACAPLAVMVGDDRDKPLQLVVYEPRDRTRRFEFAADLAETVLAYLDGYATAEPDDAQPYPDAPQLLVPNAGGVAFIRLLGRSTRFRRTEGDYAVPAAVPQLGRWLSYYAQRAEATGSALLVPLTAALADHWATGQSAVEDANLAALLSWIDPPDGMTGPEAARLAEDPVRCPPAGPATDPTFDNEVLDHLVRAVSDAAGTGGGAALARARAAMDAALRSQLELTWELAWRSVDLLRALPEAASVQERWKSDRWSFTGQVDWVREGGAPQPRRDGAVAAARRLARLEREQQRLAVQRAYDDPLVMAEYRLTGEAFVGTVMAADPARLDTEGKRAKLRPWITVRTMDEVVLDTGTVLRSPDRPGQDATIVTVAACDDVVSGELITRVTLELKGGMGQAKVAPPGTMPSIGDEVTYTTLRDEFQRSPEFPAQENTPWTHGGPPLEYVPTDDDAREDWS
jgi:hypothetical protein